LSHEFVDTEAQTTACELLVGMCRALKTRRRTVLFNQQQQQQTATTATSKITEKQLVDMDEAEFSLHIENDFAKVYFFLFFCFFCSVCLV
jgi:hypothetical protein